MIREASQKFYTGYAERKEVQPKVALLDLFQGAEDGTAHGEISESVLLSSGNLKDADVQRLHSSFSTRVKAIFDSAGEPDAVDGFVRDAAVNFYQINTMNLELLAKEQPGVKVISQSQSQSPARVAQLVSGLEKDFPGLQALVGRGLGLDQSASQAEVLEKLILRAEEIFRNDDAVKEARADYEEQAQAAAERGVVQVVAGGNLGHFAQALAQAGVKTAPDSFRNLLVNDHTTVVGASDDDGAPAEFNSPNAGIEVYADGIAVPWTDGDKQGTSDGSSVAVPQVAARAVQLMEEHPDWTPFQVEGALAGLESHRLGLGEEVELSNGRRFSGDGTVDDFVFEVMGEGFITGLEDPGVDQFLEARGKNVRFGIPGNAEDQFQIVTARTSDSGARTFMLETYWGENHHVLKATHEHGQWQPDKTVEEVHLKS